MSVIAIAPVFLEGYCAQQGSSVAGAALALQAGVLTKIHAAGHATGAGRGRGKIRLRFNSEISRPACLGRIMDRFGERLDDVPMDISQTCRMPDWAGSAVMLSRERSLCLALNAWCGEPYSLEECEGIAKKAGMKAEYPRLTGGPAGGMHVRFMDGKIRHVRLTDQELRMPITLRFYGRACGRTAGKAQMADEWMWADGADEKMRPNPSLGRFAKASHYFAGRTRQGRWARKMLEGEELAGVWMENRCVFELGTAAKTGSGAKAPEGEGNAAITGPKIETGAGPAGAGRTSAELMVERSGAAAGKIRKTPKTLITYATNLGARVLPPDA